MNATSGCCADFEADYELSAQPEFRAVEREVLGSDFGATSWTTRAQADHLAMDLDLTPGAHLLELGAGSGWPGLYLSERSGCQAALLDIPFNALTQARNRALAMGLREVGVLSASGTALPFPARHFDALSHSDVLCCLPQKTLFLRECRRVARPGAPMAFYVIAPGTALDAAQRAEAAAVGPPFVETGADYAPLLAETGWRTEAREDATPEYARALSALVDALERDAAGFRSVLGDHDYGEMINRRRAQLRAVCAGLLVRERFLARSVLAPTRRSGG